MPPEPGDLLHQPQLSVHHQFLMAAIPQVVTVTEGSRYAAADRFERVLADRLRIQGGQRPMPVDARAGFVDGGHVLPQSVRRAVRPAALDRTLVMFPRQPVLVSDGRGSSRDSLVRRLGGAL